MFYSARDMIWIFNYERPTHKRRECPSLLNARSVERCIKMRDARLAYGIGALATADNELSTLLASTAVSA